MSSELATVAAKWWADHLRTKPKMDSGTPYNDAFIQIAASNQTGLDEMGITFFELALREMLAVRLQHEHSVILDVDYRACDLLREAGRIVGIDLNNRLPIKTFMVIRDGEIRASVGYGAPLETIQVGE